MPANAQETQFRIPGRSARGQADAGERRVPQRGVERYDLMNDLMSGGLHRLWKDVMVTALNPPRDPRRFRLSTSPAAPATSPSAPRGGRRRLSRDPSATSMRTCWRVGRGRAEERGYDDCVTFLEGNAEALAFPDSSFDAYTIAFGIRNVPRIERALSEALTAC